MPQVFGADELGLIHEASLWAEAASEREIERATYPDVAQEARSRGLFPLRMGTDPIWYHPTSGEQVSLAPAHAGGSGLYSRIPNDMAELKRRFPSAEELAKRNRTPEEREAEENAAAAETRAQKALEVQRAKQQKDQASAAAAKKLHGPFTSEDVEAAFNMRGEKARAARPDDTVQAFRERLSALPLPTRQKLHRATFPDRYK